MWRISLAVLVLCGCFGAGNAGDDDDDPPCGGPGIDLTTSLRDPSTNLCVDFVTRFECDSSCGPCPVNQPLPPHGACESACTELEEPACLTTSGCQAAYTDASPSGPAMFTGCWEIASSRSTNPYETCATHDALSCASDERCAAYYRVDAPGDFARCAVEPAP